LQLTPAPELPDPIVSYEIQEDDVAWSSLLQLPPASDEIQEDQEDGVAMKKCAFCKTTKAKEYRKHPNDKTIWLCRHCHYEFPKLGTCANCPTILAKEWCIHPDNKTLQLCGNCHYNFQKLGTCANCGTLFSKAWRTNPKNPNTTICMDCCNKMLNLETKKKPPACPNFGCITKDVKSWRADPENPRILICINCYYRKDGDTRAKRARLGPKREKICLEPNCPTKPTRTHPGFPKQSAYQLCRKHFDRHQKGGTCSCNLPN
ncbi:MAG TPA: hypothetical protein VLE95_07585, partial [Chlamydiales bacterium]|nr:hypothetical protein [Chlamydiales bacterium]